jgi:CPA1 family monovalent cation:H+ antiporter
VLKLLGLELPFIYALLFGALISPTDPIAVLSILKRVGVPKDIETLITGESLFNDGVGVVIFTVILSLANVNAHGNHASEPVNIPLLFAQEALGGIFFGLVIGLIAYYFLKAIDNYTVEILITLALVVGGYALAMSLHTSGPLAMVIAGLFIGNRGRLFAMSAKTREHLDTFWELIDEILNAVLFVLIGLEMILVGFKGSYFVAVLFIIPIVLLGRFISVGGPISLMRLRRNFLPYTVRMMVWGGLRGGISIALALSLPIGAERNLIIGLTYGVVVFAILIQGLSIGQVAKRIPQTN